MESGADIRSYRSGLSAYLALGLVWWVLFVIFVIGTLRTSLEIAGGGLLFTAVPGVGFPIWLAGFKLEFGDGWMRYRTLFRAYEIRTEDISKAVYATGVAKYTKVLLPPNRVEVFLKSGGNEDPVMINTKVFSREALVTLREYLAPYV
jgi:hypothetical protein